MRVLRGTQAGVASGPPPPNDSASAPTAWSLGLVAGLIVLTLDVLTTAGGGYWLDSNEWIAAAFSLGNAHSPGHPAYLLAAKAGAWLPVGPAAYRINLVSSFLTATAAALAAMTVRDIAFVMLDDAAVRAKAWAVRVVAVGAAASIALSGAFWAQATRAEVYALNTLIAAVVVWATVGFLVRRDHRLPFVAAAAIGIGGANHHYLTLSLLPAVATLLGLTPAGREWVTVRRLTAAAALALSCLAAYSYLPLRALADPLVNWSDPDTVERFARMVAAAEFQASVTPQAHPGLSESLSAVVFSTMENLHPVGWAAGVVGLLLLARRHAPLAAVLATFVAANVGANCVMDFDPSNPDAWGYLSASVLVVGVLATVPLTAVATLPRIPGAAAALVLVAAWASSQTATWSERSNLANFRGCEVIEDALLTEAPPSSIALSGYFSGTFARWQSQVVQGRRPDLRCFHQSFGANRYRGHVYVGTLAHHFPSLQPVWDAYLAHDRYPRSALLEQAKQSAVLTEPEFDSGLPASRLRAAGAQFYVAPAATASSGTRPTDWWSELEARLRQRSTRDPWTRAWRLWQHAHSAGLLVQMNELTLARWHLQKARSLGSRSPLLGRIAAWAAALEQLAPAERVPLLESLSAQRWSELFERGPPPLVAPTEGGS